MKLAYADPPYPGQSYRHYRHHPDYDGEVDHKELIERLTTEYDGWILHTSSPALRDILPICPDTIRTMAWVKPFAAFKRNVPVAYAWEPVIVQAARTPTVSKDIVSRDWVSESITMKKGLVGAKPYAVCVWAFNVMGARPDEDILDDLYPGSGAVTEAWKKWGKTRTLWDATL